ncbi:hypothetical protein [Paenibacillus sp. NFR01]|uniref:hypothetical protein n=1 Tax=Paenibacillus sp. NFR01 TaxID=1566279 RepID=UPI0008B435A2|nr:hypothetical protein [Paenibacillus sp. NFR01]SEU19641.1 hypothetical protein SAMN03159358_3901 [Paenibacillus sp. NFR01]
MKPFNLSLFLSSVVLGVSIIVGCILITNNQAANGKEAREPEPVQETLESPKPLMTLQETADYLNLTEEQVKTIILHENYILEVSHSYSGMMFPYLKINNEILVSRDALGEWIKESTGQRQEYTRR